MKIEPLRMWVQSILPVVYDDSLSYYEMVSKIKAKTNEVIEQVNTNTHDIETLNMIIEKLGDPDELRALIEQVEIVINDLYTDDTPVMDSIAGSPGVAEHAARSDHSHPSDTSKADKNIGILQAAVGDIVKVKTVVGGIPTEFEAITPDYIRESGGTLNGTLQAGGSTINMGSTGRILGLQTPDSLTEATNKQYVDNKDIDAKKYIFGVVLNGSVQTAVNAGDYVYIINTFSLPTYPAIGLYTAKVNLAVGDTITANDWGNYLTYIGAPAQALNDFRGKVNDLVNDLVKSKYVYIDTWTSDSTPQAPVEISNGYEITAVPDTGYKFLCWNMVNTTGWVMPFPLDLEVMTQPTTHLYWATGNHLELPQHIPDTSQYTQPKIGLSFLEIKDI